MFENVSVDGMVIVPAKPNWVHGGMSARQFMRYYSNLAQFYIIETPIETLSASSIPITSRGWSKPWSKPEYLNRKMKDVMTNKQAVFSASSYKRMEEALSRANLLNDTVETNPVERIAIYNNQNNQMLSILYHLRNSLCHGRFCLFEAKRTKWIALEDVVPRSDPEGAKLSARMVVKYQTLTKWRDLITRGPQ